MKKVLTFILTAVVTLSLSGLADAQEQSTAETSALDKFNFRTSDEMRVFMKEYNPAGVLEWGEATWEVESETLHMTGKLLPDKEHFSSIQVEPCGKADEEWVPDVMFAAYQEICSKTGLEFPGAEEDIKGIASLAEPANYEIPDFELRISPRASFGRPNFYLRRAEEELAQIPYNPADALAYMQSVGGGEVKYSRKVTGEDYELWDSTGEYPYGWYGTLDGNERLYTVSAEYFGDNPEEGKAFFTAFTEFFVSGDVQEDGIKLILDRYDLLEDRKAEYADTEAGYRLSLFRSDRGHRMSISVDKDQAPSEAPLFPNTDEQAALQLGTVATFGISEDIQMPETVLYEKDGVQILLVKAYYTKASELSILLRMKGAPDDAVAEVTLEKINGNPVDFSNCTFSYNVTNLLGRDLLESTIDIRLTDLRSQIPDFTRLSSLTFKGNYRENTESDVVQFEDITCE